MGQRTTDGMKQLLHRIAGALERLAPPPPPAGGLEDAEAFVWRSESGELVPVAKVNRIAFGLLKGIDRQADILYENSRRFAQGLPANNALLWGARGMGKSSLVKAVHAKVNADRPEAGADALIFFNRFYQPDIDVEELEVQRTLVLSTSSALLLRLRWLAILSGQLDCSFAVTGGVHGEIDAVKAIMTGADAVQMVSALLKHGPDYLRIVRRELAQWLIDHDYDSLAQAKGSMNLSRSPDPGAYERANYMDILKSWKAEL